VQSNVVVYQEKILYNSRFAAIIPYFTRKERGTRLRAPSLVRKKS
jgi:hypothetical protein